MIQGAFFMTPARVGIVADTVLLAVVSGGHVGGTGRDGVGVDPPRPTNPLLRLDEVIISPHIGTGTIDSLRLKAEGYSRNIRRVLAGEEPLGLVTPVAIRP